MIVSPGPTTRARLTGNLSANIYAMGVNLSIQVIGVSVFLAAWGMTRYGEWLLLSAIPSYFAMSDLGLSSVAGNQMAMYAARDQRRDAIATFQGSWMIVTALSLVLFLAALFAVSADGLGFVLNRGSITGEQARSTLLVLIAYTLATLQTNQFAAAFRCANRTATGIAYLGTARLVEFVAAAAAAGLGMGFPGVALTMLLARVLVTVVLIGHLRHSIPWLQFGFARVNWGTIPSLLRLGIAFMGFPAGHALSVQGMLLVVGHGLGPAATVIFSTTRTFTRFASQAVNVVSITVWPELSVAFGRSDVRALQVLHQKLVAWGIAIAMIAVVGVLSTASLILPIWTHGAVLVHWTLLLILVLGLLPNSVWSLSYTVPLATNRHSRVAFAYVGGTLLSLAVAHATISGGGMIAAALSVSITDVVMLTVVIPLALRITNETASSFFAGVTKVFQHRHS